MNYSLSWKILSKNKFISILFILVIGVVFFEPVKTIYNATTGFSNVSLPEINFSFMPGCIIWFSVMLFATHELIVQIRDNASQILWIASKDKVYKNVFKFFVINDAVIFGIIVLIQVVLFACFGKGIMVFLLKIIIDIFFYYFIVGIIAILIAIVLSLIEKPLLEIILMIIMIISTTSLLDFDNKFISYVHDFFEFLPHGTSYHYSYLVGSHINISTIGLIVLWISLLVIIIKYSLKIRRFKNYILQIIGLALGIYIIMMPDIERFGTSGYNNGKNIYTAFQVYEDANISEQTNDEALANAGFVVTKYEMDIKVRWQLSNTVKMWVDNTSLDLYTFTLYNRYRVESVTDQNGKELEFEQKNDLLKITGTGELECIIVEYNGSAPPCEADFEAVRLYAGIPWYPYPGEQNIVSSIYYEEYDCYSSGMYNVCENNSAEYYVKISSIHEIYSNLKKNNNSFEGKTDILMLVGGMIGEEIEGNIHYIFPLEISYYFKYDNGIEDWKTLANSFLTDCQVNIDSTDEFYCICGSDDVFMSRIDPRPYVLGDNILMLNTLIY